MSAFTWPAGKRAALSLTFDDARESQITRGLSILSAHDVKATFYVSIRTLEKRVADWRAASEAGHEIGNHTLTHPCSGNFQFSRCNALEDYTLDRMESELTEASAIIERFVGVRPVTFAYPCGQTFVGRGEGVRSYVPLVARYFTVGRAAFNETHNDPSFFDPAQANAISGDGADTARLVSLVEQTLAAGGWLILLGHEIGDGGRQTFRADVLDALCRHVKDPARGLWVDTAANIGGHIRRERSIHASDRQEGS